MSISKPIFEITKAILLYKSKIFNPHLSYLHLEDTEQSSCSSNFIILLLRFALFLIYFLNAVLLLLLILLSFFKPYAIVFHNTVPLSNTLALLFQ